MGKRQVINGARLVQWWVGAKRKFGNKGVCVVVVQ